MSQNMIFIGYRISRENFDKKFSVQKPEVFHLEDRFDSKTGQKIAKRKKVVDTLAKRVYRYNLRDYDGNFVELLEDYSREIGCEWWLEQRHRDADTDIILGFGDEEMSYQEALGKKAEVEALGLRLTENGLKPGIASIIQCFSE